MFDRYPAHFNRRFVIALQAFYIPSIGSTQSFPFSSPHSSPRSERRDWWRGTKVMTSKLSYARLIFGKVARGGQIKFGCRWHNVSRFCLPCVGRRRLRIRANNVFVWCKYLPVCLCVAFKWWQACWVLATSLFPTLLPAPRQHIAWRSYSIVWLSPDGYAVDGQTSCITLCLGV